MRKAVNFSGSQMPATQTANKFLGKKMPTVDTALYNALSRQERRQVDKLISKVPAWQLEQGTKCSLTRYCDVLELPHLVANIALALYGHEAN